MPQYRIIKVVNIPRRFEDRLSLSRSIPKEIPVQFEFDLEGIKCEQLVNALVEVQANQVAHSEFTFDSGVIRHVQPRKRTDKNPTQ